MVAERMVVLHRMVSGNVEPLGIGSGIHVDIFLYVIMGFHNSNNLVLRFENVRKDLTLCRRPPDGNIAEKEIKLVIQFRVTPSSGGLFLSAGGLRRARLEANLRRDGRKRNNLFGHGCALRGGSTPLAQRRRPRRGNW